MAAGILAVGLARGAGAQVTPRTVQNPPTLGVHAVASTPLALTAIEPAVGLREKQLDLKVVYTDSRLFNPSTGRWDTVRLRSYNGTDVSPTAPYVAPTIEISPGDRVVINLDNELPSDPSCLGDHPHANKPHCFNGTNLHTHGLWVSPAGNSDNVLLSINPGTSFRYQYDLPSDHPAGTFWYHTHRHGSTALQVSSGMAGALIVRGDRLPTADAHGDIDTLLKGLPVTERILVFQQIQYACLDAKGNIKVKRVNNKVVAWTCDPKDVGGIEFYADPSGYGLVVPASWGESGRYTSINGQVLPTFEAKAGDVERWRMIHAGVRDTISLQFYRMKRGAPRPGLLAATQTDRYIAADCVGDPIPYHQIAADGLTRAAARKVAVTTFQPGYREDALVVFPEAGDYCVVNAQVAAASEVSEVAASPRLLGFVHVAPGAPVGDISGYLQSKLVAAANQTMPVPVRAAVIADLNDGLKLTRFTPHPTITDSEVTGYQTLAFYIDTSDPKNTQYEVSNGPTFDPKPYDPSRIDRAMTLGEVDEWTLESRFASHPFHIHVNPFQVVKILDPNGKDVSGPDAVDDAGGKIDPQYPGLKGVWKDTLWVKSLIPGQATYPKGIYTVVVRTRYERYIGEYVLHCHILDHEDQGMMENVSISPPTGKLGAKATSGMSAMPGMDDAHAH